MYLHNFLAYLTSIKSSSDARCLTKHSTMKPLSAGFFLSMVMSALQLTARLFSVAREADNSSSVSPDAILSVYDILLRQVIIISHIRTS